MNNRVTPLRVEQVTAMKILSRIRSAIAAGGLALTLFLGIQSLYAAPAMATPQQPSFLAATAQQLDSRAKSDVNRVAGAGTADRLEGYVDQAAGTVEKKAGKVASAIEGTADQVQGRAKADIGRVKGAAEDTAEAAGESGENLIDNVIDFFD